MEGVESFSRLSGGSHLRFKEEPLHPEKLDLLAKLGPGLAARDPAVALAGFGIPLHPVGIVPFQGLGSGHLGRHFRISPRPRLAGF